MQNIEVTFLHKNRFLEFPEIHLLLPAVKKAELSFFESSASLFIPDSFSDV